MSLASTARPAGPGSRRLAPLLAGTAAGSLGATDLEEIGVSQVAVDILELGLAIGWERLRHFGDLRRFTAWEGEIVAVARYTDAATMGGGGWRARQLPQLLRRDKDTLRLRSPINGAVIDVAVERLATEAAALGAVPVKGIGEQSSVTWSDPDSPAPAGAVVITDLAATEAAAGRFRSAGGWEPIEAPPDGPLVRGCRCRACEVATAPYIAHLWSANEITAQHLLGWHNLRQLLVEVEVVRA
jgi:queuine/archaeosine tRNA-ribosyltransferase